MPVQIVLVVVLCHLAISHPMKCHSDTIWRGENFEAICPNDDLIAERWKATRYAGNDWVVLSYGCKVWSRLS